MKKTINYLRTLILTICALTFIFYSVTFIYGDNLITLTGVVLSSGDDNWGLLNLILVCNSMLIAIYFLYINIREENKKNAMYYEKDKGLFKFTINKLKIPLINVLLAVIAIYIFIFGEENSKYMVIVNYWSLPLIIILIVQVYSLIIFTKFIKK